ncbi:MAG: hypothetical protein ABIR29_12900 [Chthoniobacterales bacterium]
MVPTGSGLVGNLIVQDLNGDSLPEVLVDNLTNLLTVLLNTSGAVTA